MLFCQSYFTVKPSLRSRGLVLLVLIVAAAGLFSIPGAARSSGIDDTVSLRIAATGEMIGEVFACRH
jgi:hypothetical protein